MKQQTFNKSFQWIKCFCFRSNIEHTRYAFKALTKKSQYSQDPPAITYRKVIAKLIVKFKKLWSGVFWIGAESN